MVVCDFCSKEVEQVYRLVLDTDYNRLGPKDVAKFACPDCSKEKEDKRVSQRSSLQG